MALGLGLSSCRLGEGGEFLQSWRGLLRRQRRWSESIRIQPSRYDLLPHRRMFPFGALPAGLPPVAAPMVRPRAHQPARPSPLGQPLAGDEVRIRMAAIAPPLVSARLTMTA